VKAISRQFREDPGVIVVIDLDGARVLLEGGWGLIRASNTQPALVLRFEAENETRLEEIKRKIHGKSGKADLGAPLSLSTTKERA
jgi:phosphomannomutase